MFLEEAFSMLEQCSHVVDDTTACEQKDLGQNRVKTWQWQRRGCACCLAQCCEWLWPFHFPNHLAGVLWAAQQGPIPQPSVEGMQGALLCYHLGLRPYLSDIQLRAVPWVHRGGWWWGWRVTACKWVGVHLLRIKGSSLSKRSWEMFFGFGNGSVEITVIAMRFAVGCPWYTFSCEKSIQMEQIVKLFWHSIWGRNISLL